jgi:hypothetical protein
VQLTESALLLIRVLVQACRVSSIRYVIKLECDVITALSVAGLLRRRVIMFQSSSASTLVCLCHLGTFHSNKRVEMAVRECVRKQGPISTAMEFLSWFHEGTLELC